MVDVRGARQCALPSCRREDFLPFECDACHGFYCLQHWNYSGHSCARSQGKDCRVILCPLCKNAIRLVYGEDVSVTFARHEGSPDCVKKTKKKCPATGCKETLGPSNTFNCTRCGQDVCLRHRYEEEHPCHPKPSKHAIAVNTTSAGGQPAGAKKRGFFGCLCGGKPKVQD
mmetsp:Transcript_43955/g.99089  ORF Transcript_43955/g.99089 Transcript_43955/m.99089 type:complete len:171 (+) Transcript_43955:74-586(+)